MEELKQTVSNNISQPSIDLSGRYAQQKSTFQRQFSNIKIEGLVSNTNMDDMSTQAKPQEKSNCELSTATQTFLYSGSDDMNYVVMMFEDEEVETPNQVIPSPQSRTHKYKNQSQQFILKDPPLAQGYPSFMTKEMRKSTDTFYNMKNTPLQIQKTHLSYGLYSTTNVNHISSPGSSKVPFGVPPPKIVNPQVAKGLPKTIKYVNRQGPNSPYSHQQSLPHTNSKTKLSGLSRNANSKNRTMRMGSATSQQREVLNRVSRFNLSEEEQAIYYQFARILKSFDEPSMLELVESVIKDSKEMGQTNFTSAVDQL